MKTKKRYRPTFQPSVKFTTYLSPDVVKKIRQLCGTNRTLSDVTETLLRAGLLNGKNK